MTTRTIVPEDQVEFYSVNAERKMLEILGETSIESLKRKFTEESQYDDLDIRGLDLRSDLKKFSEPFIELDGVSARLNTFINQFHNTPGMYQLPEDFVRRAQEAIDSGRPFKMYISDTQVLSDAILDQAPVFKGFRDGELEMANRSAIISMLDSVLKVIPYAGRLSLLLTTLDTIVGEYYDPP